MIDSHERMHRATRAPLRFSDGLLPGVEAGAVMLLELVILALGAGRPFFDSVEVIGAIATGGPLRDDPGAALFGLVVHFGVSALLGGLFARVVGATGRVRQLGLGLAYGVYVWLVVQLVVLPLLAPSLAARLGTFASFLVGHLAYGLMLGATVPSRADIDERAAPA